ncbi:MAG: protein kinase [Planctomycetota bacterium]
MNDPGFNPGASPHGAGYSAGAMVDPRSDLLFGKIALNWRLISRDLLNRALHYQRTQEPHKPLGEILLEKGVLSREHVNEILAYQQRINAIKSTQSAFQAPGLEGSMGGTPPHGTPMPQMPPMASGAHTMPMGGMSGAHTMGGMSGAHGMPPHLLGNDAASQQTAFLPPPSANNGGFHQPGATPPPDHDPLIGAVIGGCTIRAKIGAGGMGAIYLASHEALRKEVVVKILPPESAANPRTVERFFREARAAAKLEHPNVVAVQDVGTTDKGLHFIVMQYIEGQNLEEKIQAEGKHTPQNAVRLVLQVANGLKAAHLAGVIHRDIKAENVLVTTSGLVKVTDFGLAKDLNSELKLTADGAMIGTPLYMAPEIGRVKEIDGRVDIYSLGVTFYYLLTGIQPFRGFTALDILSAKAHDKLKPPELHAPDLPNEYRSVLGKMLEKDRDQRYCDVDDLIRDLEALDRNLPITAGEPSIWPPREGTSNSRIVKRNRNGTTRTPTARGDEAGNKKKLLMIGGLLAAIVVIALLTFLLFNVI